MLYCISICVFVLAYSGICVFVLAYLGICVLGILYLCIYDCVFVYLYQCCCDERVRVYIGLIDYLLDVGLLPALSSH